MQLRDIFRVMFKHKGLLALSLVAGLAMGFLAVYRFDSLTDGSPTLETRTKPVYTATKLLLVDRPGFGIGKVGTDTANPYHYDRTVKLAGAYSKLITSPMVISITKKKFSGELTADIRATAVRDAPMIKIRATDLSAAKARKTVEAVAESFEQYLTGTQGDNQIPASQRIVVKSLGPADKPIAQSSGGWQVALLSFLAPVGAFVTAVFMVENLKLEGKEDR